MGIETIIQFIAKTTIRVIAFVYNDAGALVSPTTSIKVTITDPDGTVKVNAVAMTLIAAGEYVGGYDYYYKTDTTLVKGWWPGEVVIIDGVTPDDRTSMGTFGFELK